MLGVREQYGVAGAAGSHPRLCSMFPTTLVETGGVVEIPGEDCAVVAAGHLVVVVGERIPRFTIRADMASAAVDVTAGLSLCEPEWYGESRSTQRPSRLVATAVDSWAVLGKPLVPGSAGSVRRVRTWHGGRLVADVGTDAMRLPVLDLLTYLSDYMTLEPGDVLFTGGVDTLPLHPGDRLAVEVDGLARAEADVVPLSLDGLQLAGGRS
ncbi:hypothetical protein BJF78_06945 [Pseudonocardia sp. CNS-139]|nr:hypothetical protein BJF78_06945 [Pseudonocardia sp. CNS-139]